MKEAPPSYHRRPHTRPAPPALFADDAGKGKGAEDGLGMSSCGEGEGADDGSAAGAAAAVAEDDGSGKISRSSGKDADVGAAGEARVAAVNAPAASEAAGRLRLCRPRLLDLQPMQTLSGGLREVYWPHFARQSHGMSKSYGKTQFAPRTLEASWTVLAAPKPMGKPQFAPRTLNLAAPKFYGKTQFAPRTLKYVG